MELEKAIEIIKRQGIMKTKPKTKSQAEIREALQCFVEAGEKQIPKKPKIVEVDMGGMDMETGEEYTYKIDEAHCTNCNSVIGNEYDRFAEQYCDKCGQKIDWSVWE